MEITDLIGKWIISSIDNDSGIRKFKPWTSDIVLEEGMQGFELKQNGDFMLYDFDQNDRPRKTHGTFKVEGSTMKISLEEPRHTNINIQIISKNNLLEIKIM